METPSRQSGTNCPIDRRNDQWTIERNAVLLVVPGLITCTKFLLCVLYYNEKVV